MPSRPPLLSELEASVSGIIIDPNSGNRIVPASRRPDGTMRKEIRIRPGYTPPEDVPKFRSHRQIESHAKALPPGSVVGFVRPGQVAVQVALSNMTSSQRKNAKRKSKRKDKSTTQVETDSGEAESNAKVDIPDDWEAEEDSKCSFDHLTDKVHDELSRSSTQDEEVQQQILQAKSGCATVEKETPPDPTAGKTALHKKKRALLKKLNQAQQLQVKLDDGEPLSPEQVDKAKQVDSLRTELDTLQLG